MPKKRGRPPSTKLAPKKTYGVGLSVESRIALVELAEYNCRSLSGQVSFLILEAKRELDIKREEREKNES